MLVLSRRLGESIQIGDDIDVTVVEVRGDMVRLGIKAPQKTQIWRKELWDAIVAENIAAAKAGSAELVMPTVPVSVFSKLGNLKTVSAKSKQRNKDDGE